MKAQKGVGSLQKQQNKFSFLVFFFFWKCGGGRVALTAILGYLQQNYRRLVNLPMEVAVRRGDGRWAVGTVPRSPAEVLLWPLWGRVEKLWEEMRRNTQELQWWDQRGERSPGQPCPATTTHTGHLCHDYIIRHPTSISYAEGTKL